jgi:hypothetical protein
MIPIANLETAVYNLLNKYKSVGVVIIWENQAEARPPKPYMSLQFITGPRKIGQDDEKVGLDGKVFKKGIRELTLSVNFMGQDAFWELSKLQEAITLPTARQMLLEDNLVLIRDNGVRDLTALMDNRFESRAQVDLDFRLTSEVKDLDSTVIETVILNNDLDNSTTQIP